jgi:hypothetical protein
MRETEELQKDLERAGIKPMLTTANILAAHENAIKN